MNVIGKRAKSAADSLYDFLVIVEDNLNKDEREQLMKTHATLCAAVKHNGGPTWIATEDEERWEY